MADSRAEQMVLQLAGWLAEYLAERKACWSGMRMADCWESRMVVLMAYPKADLLAVR